MIPFAHAGDGTGRAPPLERSAAHPPVTGHPFRQRGGEDGGSPRTGGQSLSRVDDDLLRQALLPLGSHSPNRGVGGVVRPESVEQLQTGRGRGPDPLLPDGHPGERAGRDCRSGPPDDRGDTEHGNQGTSPLSPDHFLPVDPQAPRIPANPGGPPQTPGHDVQPDGTLYPPGAGAVEGNGRPRGGAVVGRGGG